MNQRDSSVQSSSAEEVGNNPGSSGEGLVVKSMLCEKPNTHHGEVLLSTALVQVIDSEGNPYTARALLDNGSQSNLISAGLCKRLKLSKSNVEISIVGINQVVSSIKHKCAVRIQSIHNGFEQVVSCLVVPQISESIPSQSIDVSHLCIPTHLNLADPGFVRQNKIDLLLGADIFYNLLCVGQISLGRNQPLLQKTRLGWIVSGLVSPGIGGASLRCNLSMNLDVQEQLTKFWALEEPPSLHKKLSEEDMRCEEIFVETTTRCDDGKFMVQIPLLDSPSKLGDSREYALKRFLALEKQFLKNQKLKDMYIAFMLEYERMGHMSVVNSDCVKNKPCYFMPHHGVINEDSSTTKLRVVFNGSARSDSGVSLNDLQYTGPNLQDELVSILLRFRQHNVIFCADVEKMYRMILIEPSQWSLQRILWRAHPSEDIREYELNTVTYGTKAAPYLAIRCLKQLGLDSLHSYPRASQIILKDFYVDDLLSGASTRDEAIQLGNEVSSILLSGGMRLRKWVSNDPLVIKNIGGVDANLDFVHLGEKNQTKTLGLYWSPQRDVLMYRINFPVVKVNTKRSILSDISKLYDPLGLLGPCIITVKVLLQKLWEEKISWDETLPLELDSKWNRLRAQFSCLNNLTISRHVVCQEPIRVEIHGFSDACLESYGGCVYIRSISADGQIKVALIFAKVKVAPLKALTIPRLELCGALLVAKLVTKIKQSVELTFDETYLWCDSTVVLGWINTPPRLLQTFVSNRIGQIKDLSNQHSWHHVRSEDNPADVLSRGIAPNKIASCEMWWHGPSWLKLEQCEWPRSSIQEPSNLPEVKTLTKICQVLPETSIFPFKRFSTLTRMKRTVAYCLRFVYNCKNHKAPRKGPLSAEELDMALKCLLKASQQESFAREILDIQHKKSSKLRSFQSLNPFIDESGLVRVGGRLQLSELSYQTQHPILISSKHHLTCLIFEDEHKRLLHAAPQLLLSSVRERYWPIGGRNLARKVVSRCLRCFRAKPQEINQIMGILPKDRVCTTPPFYITGTDFAGPFVLKDRDGRGSKTSKCYICIFVCFSTKAVHLELVSSLTTEAFIATLRRFTSRRGKPKTIYSDNGSTFVGANSELQILNDFLQTHSLSLSETVSNDGINWKFIPSYSPNFGGLWEAGVKSCKYHLKRVLTLVPLTFEQFCTLLAQVEAILNSRPLTPMSPDPNDMDVLTPSHFLIGRRLTSVADPTLKDLPENRLSKFQHLQLLTQHLWTRWSKEYMTELQHRHKWQHEQPEMYVGQLVLIKENNLPPLQWKMGRISEVCSGPDNRARVAIVRCKGGEIKRSISNLCPLPYNVNN